MDALLLALLMQPIPSKDIDNFHKVSATLYRGAQPTAKGLLQLKEMGIRTVINLRTHTEADRERAKDVPGLVCESLVISWNPLRAPRDEDVIRFLKLAGDPKRQPVFVHCRQGVDRTGLMVAAYRIVVEKRPRDEAIREMKNLGFHAHYHLFERYLRNLDADKMRGLLSQ